MALTRTEDKTDKAIARLLLQNPMGLTIGDITAEAKCTPQTARKSLARIGADKDASGMLYVLRDDDEQASEAAPDPAPAAVAEVPEPLVWVDGATHYQPHQGAFYKRVSAPEWYVWSRIDCEPMHWCKAPGTSDGAEWVVRNQPTDPAPAAAQKPLRRGDLVEYDGRVCVVAENDIEGGVCSVAAHRSHRENNMTCSSKAGNLQA